ncbi:hypothetical protein ZEAMMB73_Zm00001d033732, partial [Zea mays]
GKGTSSFGKRRNKTHTLCIRCSRHSFHLQKSTCSSCDYTAARIRKLSINILSSVFDEVTGFLYSNTNVSAYLLCCD